LARPLFWLVYEREDGVHVFLQHAHTIVAARMRAALAGVEGSYTGGDELDDESVGKIPKAMIGRPLTGKQASDLIDKISVATPRKPNRKR
jgi:hypothetical protein